MIKIVMLSYFFMAFAWFVFEIFIFQKPIKNALFYGLIWPWQMRKFNRGTKTFPSQTKK